MLPLVAKIRDVIKTADKVVKPDIAYKLTLMNPSAPSMIALPKIHKANIPMRPIINYKTAPSYKLSKYLKTILKDTIDLENKHTIDNTMHLVNRLDDVEITENTRLVSFDIKDLYPSIPVTDTINIIHRTLLKKSKDNEFSKQLISN